MRSVRTIIIAVVVVSPWVFAQAPANDPAAAIVAAAREALGGEKKLGAVKTIVATGRTRQVRGENLVPIEFEIAMEFPDRYVRKDEIPAQESGPTSTGFNGAELIQFPAPAPPPARAGGPPPPTPEQMDAQRKTRLAGVKQDALRLMLGMSAGAFPSAPLTFSYVAKAEAPQGKADVLAVSGPDNFSARLFVNADTHLPIMVTWTAPAPPQPPSRRGGPAATAGQGADPVREGGPGRGEPSSRSDPAPPATERAAAGRETAPASPQRGVIPPRGGGPPESRLYFSDYRDVNGLQFPFRLRRALGPDTTEETTFDGFKINPKIDPKKFEIRK